MAQWLMLVLLILFSACAGRAPFKPSKAAKGFYTTTKFGDTLWKIAQTHHVTAQQIAEWNNIQDPDQVRAGQRLYIPKTKAGSGKYDAPLAFDRDRFQWPVRGVVISGFGMRDGSRHDGVDIKAASGSPVMAAADGEVVYSGNLSGYGNMLILRHSDRHYTTYAHNQRNLATLHSRVKAGETIALVGSTGRATGPHLHFEVRVGATPRNPLFFLPTENNAGDKPKPVRKYFKFKEKEKRRKR